MRVATWNLKHNNSAQRAIEYLAEAPWDVACLQEVNPAAAGLVMEREGWEIADGLALAGAALTAQRPHAAAIVARNGWRLHDATLMAETQVPGRGVHARAAREGDELTVVSWHAPNAQPWKGVTKQEAIAQKMAGYEALGRCLADLPGPLVLGMDANHWNLQTEITLADPPADDDKYRAENLFFSSGAEHRLRDALLAYLAERPDRHGELLALRPGGPLEVTHDRGGAGIPDRFDYLMISEELGVEEMVHEYEEEQKGVGGSDHGFVSAALVRSP